MVVFTSDVFASITFTPLAFSLSSYESNITYLKRFQCTKKCNMIKEEYMNGEQTKNG